VYNFCKEKDFEACVIKLYLSCSTIVIVSIYRSSTGKYFLKKLEALLNFLKDNSKDLIICGDFNINFLNDSTHKELINSLLATYSLFSTVQFPTRICNDSISTIDNIFINTVKYNNSTVHPMVKGLSDHDAQIIILRDITMSNNTSHFYLIRKINKMSVSDFNLKLSYESWEDVFSHNDMDVSFNNFLNTYLRTLYSSFPIKK
jgi:hypothetical protein